MIFQGLQRTVLKNENPLRQNLRHIHLECYGFQVCEERFQIKAVN